MNILVVGNVLKDVYLNLDSQNEHLETDKNGVNWLNLSFDAKDHHFFNRNSSLGGAAVTLEVFKKMGLTATVSGADLHFDDDGLSSNLPAETYRYILIADGQVSYFTPSKEKNTNFVPPVDHIDCIYIDRSAKLDADTIAKISTYLDKSEHTKLALYIKNLENPHLQNLVSRANLLFLENNVDLPNADHRKIIHLSEDKLSYMNITETISIGRVDMLTHLSAYSVISATILSGLILGKSVDDALALARINVENSQLNSVLTLSEMQKIAENTSPKDDIELIAANLVFKNKGILAADESGGSIKKKFAKLNIPDTYENRRDYRNIFFTTPNLEKYINGVILFDETTKQLADDGRNYVDFLTSLCIIPGIKVDQGLAKFENSLETYTKGLDDLEKRLREYYIRGLRFAKWRTAFEVKLSTSGTILTPSNYAIDENCRILAEYASKCQSAGLVPIVEPEVVYDGYYSIEQNAEITGHVLDVLFKKLADFDVNLRATILKVNMVLPGKNYIKPATPEEIGQKTAKTLVEHVPQDLAGVVFLSGGQTAEQATENLIAIQKNGPFPWPVTFSFARALQDPALYAWAGNNENADKARQAFLERLIANTEALKK